MSCSHMQLQRAMAQALVVAVLWLTAHANAQQPPQRLEDLIRDLPIEDQSQRLTSSAERGVIIGGFKTPADFALLRSDKALHFYMDFLTEPLSGDWLDALDALLQKQEYENARFRAAVLLFRHGRASGRAHLLEKLKQNHDLQAALVFAVAQEPGTEEAIVDAIVTALLNQTYRYPLDEAVIRWGSAELEQAMRRPHVAEAFQSRSSLIAYSRLLGAHAGEDLAIKVRQAAFDSARYQLETRLAFVTTTLRQNPNDAQARATLLHELATRPNEWVFKAIAGTADATFNDDLVLVLNRSVAPPGNETRDEWLARLRNGLYALEAIVRLGEEMPAPQVIALYSTGWQDAASLQRLELLMIRSGNDLERLTKWHWFCTDGGCARRHNHDQANSG